MLREARQPPFPATLATMQAGDTYTLRTRHVPPGGAGAVVYVRVHPTGNARWLELSVSTTPPRPVTVSISSGVTREKALEESIADLPGTLRWRIFRAGASLWPAHGTTGAEVREALVDRHGRRVRQLIAGITGKASTERVPRASGYDGPARLLYDCARGGLARLPPRRPLYRFALYEGVLRCVFIGRAIYHVVNN